MRAGHGWCGEYDYARDDERARGCGTGLPTGASESEVVVESLHFGGPACAGANAHPTEGSGGVPVWADGHPEESGGHSRTRT
ncbi:unannotated protein [freshwater metagenome]|uniref:Unannotated protein n=1 Tax=freshwater metagenome TaxID=449393 RepID=A0A6J6NBV1_9ZZZZ